MKIDHIGIAVKDLEAAIETYSKIIGRPPDKIEMVSEQKVRIAIYNLSEARLELLQPTSEDSPVARHLARRGEGLHHIALAVDGDLQNTLDHLAQNGIKLIDEQPRIGSEHRQIAFIHPQSLHGVLIELTSHNLESQH